MDAIGADLLLHQARYNDARLTLYRATIQHQVRHVSPLLEDAAPDLAMLLDQVRPSSGWPLRPLPTAAGALLCPRGFRLLAERPLSPRKLLPKGNELRVPHQPAAMGEVTLHVRSRGLEVSVRLAPVLVRTQGARGVVWAPGRYPEMVMISIVGEPVSSVLAHPLLVGRDYPVVQVHYDAVEDATGFVFLTGRRPWVGPWPQLVPRTCPAPPNDTPEPGWKPGW